MKTFLTIIATFLLAQSVMAKDLATFRFATRNNDGEISSFTVYETVLTEEQELKITTHRSGGVYPFYLPVGEPVTDKFVKPLNDEVFAMLKDKVLRLSVAEITTREAQVVCMMMPGPTMSNDHLSVLRGYDWNSQEFKGEMELVAGPRGCWVRKAIFPSKEYDRVSASELKSLIKVLAVDFAH